mmetsp:Transcript_38225/g.88946  ORF Transcript_38225/g.88946 Transcript_38225/m.88946 type:complete len:137 (-) Transcript_38225:63-473(-)
MPSRATSDGASDDGDDVECVSCVRQKEASKDAERRTLGTLTTVAANGGGGASPAASTPKAVDCNALYARVSKCMADRRGQVSQCGEEWTAFRECHGALAASTDRNVHGAVAEKAQMEDASPGKGGWLRSWWWREKG